MLACSVSRCRRCTPVSLSFKLFLYPLALSHTNTHTHTQTQTHTHTHIHSCICRGIRTRRPSRQRTRTNKSSAVSKSGDIFIYIHISCWFQMPPSASLGSPQMHVAHPPEILILMKYTPKNLFPPLHCRVVKVDGGRGGHALQGFTKDLNTCVSNKGTSHVSCTEWFKTRASSMSVCVLCV